MNAGGGTVDVQSGDVEFQQAIGGTGALTKSGPGTLILSGLNTYSGATTINGGVLSTFGQAIPTTSAVTIANAAILNMESDLTIGSLAGAGTVRAGQASGVALTTGGDNTSTTFAGTLADCGCVFANTLALTKTGSGVFTLTGNNTYTGGTTVNAGTLAIATGGAIASDTTVNNGGTFVVNGTAAGVTINAGGTLGGNGTVGNTTFAGGTLSPGNSIGTITIQGNLAMSSATAYIVEVSPTAADRTNVTGTATLGGTGAGAVRRRQLYRTQLHDPLRDRRAQRDLQQPYDGGLPAGFTASLSYTGTDAVLNLTAVLGEPPPQEPPPGSRRGSCRGSRRHQGSSPCRTAG